MKRHNSTAASIDYGPLADALERLNQPCNIQVVHGDNKELSIRWTGFAVFAWGSTIALLMLGVWMQTRWAAGLVIILWGVGTLVAIPVILFIASGDIPVLRQIGRTGKLEEHRLDKATAIADRYLDLEYQRAEWEHVADMGRLAVDGEIAALRAEVRLLADRQHVATAHDTVTPASPSYTPAQPSKARRMVSDFVVGTTTQPGLFRRGKPDEEKIAPDGQMKIRVPWSSRGDAGEKLSREMRDIVACPAPGAAPLFVTRKNSVYYNIEKYPDKGAVIDVLGVV